jgi:hypothetical protein
MEVGKDRCMLCECLLARRVRQKHLYVYQGLLPTLFPLWVISLHQAMGSACHITLYTTNRPPACLSRTHTCTHNSHVVVAPACETKYARGYERWCHYLSLESRTATQMVPYPCTVHFIKCITIDQSP